VEDVGANRGDDHGGRLRQLAQRRGIADVGLDQLEVGAGRVERRQMCTHRFQLGAIAPGQGPARRGRGMLRQVFRGKATGEAGGAEQHEIVLTLGSHACSGEENDRM